MRHCRNQGRMIPSFFSSRKYKDALWTLGMRLTCWLLISSILVSDVAFAMQHPPEPLPTSSLTLSVKPKASSTAFQETEGREARAESAVILSAAARLEAEKKAEQERRPAQLKIETIEAEARAALTKTASDAFSAIELTRREALGIIHHRITKLLEALPLEETRVRATVAQTREEAFAEIGVAVRKALEAIQTHLKARLQALEDEERALRMSLGQTALDAITQAATQAKAAIDARVREAEAKAAETRELDVTVSHRRPRSRRAANHLPSAAAAASHSEDVTAVHPLHHRDQEEGNPHAAASSHSQGDDRP